MSYSIRVKNQRNGKSYWHTIGRLFVNPAKGEYNESLGLRFNSLPAAGAECKAFPADDDQEPAECSERFQLVVPVAYTDADGEDQTYYHTIGTVFHNPAEGEHSENFNIVFDSLPLQSDVRAYPPKPEQ